MIFHDRGNPVTTLTPNGNTYTEPGKKQRKKQNESRQGESRTTNHWHSSCNT